MKDGPVNRVQRLGTGNNAKPNASSIKSSRVLKAVSLQRPASSSSRLASRTGIGLQFEFGVVA